MEQSAAMEAVLANRQLIKSAQVLTGIITGIVADGTLHDLEVQMLNTWLTEHAEVTTAWPGSAIARHLQELLADGVITPEERTHFLDTLQSLVGADFSETGSVSTDVAALPFDDATPVELRDCGVCLTGEFVYGTRAACESVTAKVGGITFPNVSRKVSYLIVGTHVSPAWVNTSYGRKIMKAMELREAGHGIAIIHERRWVEALTR